MVVLTRATEDYLKTIFALTSIGKPVTTGGLAHELGVSSPSVTAMVKRLQDAQFLERASGRSLRLTAHGEQLALRVVRRHRLLETFLAATLGMGWDEVHAEAELLEHALSERLEDRIDAALGHPTRDPHGDPIPPGPGTTTRPGANRWTPPPPGAGSGWSASRTATAPPCAISARWVSSPAPCCTSNSRTPSGARAGSCSTGNATAWARR